VKHLFLCFILLAACQRQENWHFKQIPTKKTASCRRITYYSKDPICGIDVELIYANEELVTYLQIRSTPLKSTSENAIQVTIQSEGKASHFLGKVHRGSQRIRLTPDLQTHLLSLLKEGKPLIIEIPGYRETIDPKRFEKVFKKLESSSFRIPFHLPI